MRPLVVMVIGVMVSLMLGGCGGQPGADPAHAKLSLYVPCGAGLQPAMDELGDLYFKHTGVRADFAYAGAGMLLSTLLTTRRGDLYIPGEAFYVDQARTHGFVAEDRPMCYMTPVIGVRKGNPKRIASLQDLARPGLRVALGDPQVIAIGPMTERILQRAGLFEAVERNLSMKAACVPELANALATHSADAGILWDVMAFQNAKDVDALPIEPKYNEASEVLVSRLTCSRQPEAARKLMDFLVSSEAAAIFHKHGYATVRPAGVRLAPRTKVGEAQTMARLQARSPVTAKHDGALRDVRVYRSARHRSLDDAVLARVRRARFAPMREGGEPVATSITSSMKLSLVGT